MKRFFIFSAIVVSLLGAGCVSPTSDQHGAVGASNGKLDVSNQHLAHLSQDIFKQTDLVELNVSHNALTGSLPAEIRALTQLQVLDASDNAMTGVPAEIGQLSMLRTLDLSNNGITGLPMELGTLTQLEVLDLRGNTPAAQDLDLLRVKLPNTQILTD